MERLPETDEQLRIECITEAFDDHAPAVLIDRTAQAIQDLIDLVEAQGKSIDAPRSELAPISKDIETSSRDLSQIFQDIAQAAGDQGGASVRPAASSAWPARGAALFQEIAGPFAHSEMRDKLSAEAAAP